MTEAEKLLAAPDCGQYSTWFLKQDETMPVIALDRDKLLIGVQSGDW